MSPAWLRRREHPPSKRWPKGHVTWQVVFRRGGRAYRIETAGTYASLKDAKIRRDLIAGWLAAGKNPKNELAALDAAPAVKLTVREWAARYQRSRIDFAANSAKNATSHIRKLDESPLADKPVDAVTLADLQELVAEWAEELKPSSIVRYVQTLRLIFDYAQMVPNPARDDRLKLPRVVGTEKDPPSAEQLVAILQATPTRMRLPLVTLEQTGMRVGEAASLVWGDVDEQQSKFRLRTASTKTSRARWVQVPRWLMDVIAATVPREDRTDERKVFVGFTENAARNAMARACRIAGIVSFSPHDLRHRRGTIWHHDPAVSLREQMERGGWTKSSIAVETYSHLQPVGEVAQETLEGLLA